MGGIAPTDDPVNRVALALRRLNSALTANNHIIGEALGLKDNDFAVPDTLNREGPRAPTELARCTRMHVATMTGILTRSGGDGWIEWRLDPADHRPVRIHAVGVDRLIEVYLRVSEELAEHASGWPVEQAKVITRFLAGVGDIITVFLERMTTEREP